MRVEVARSRASQYVALGVFAALSLAAAGIGNLGTAEATDTWYPTLDRPTWTPDPSVIGLAWTILYPVIAVAGWLAWRERDRAQRGTTVALVVWGVQMALNAAWSLAFFAARSPAAGLVVIVLLWLSIAGFIVTAWRAGARLAAGLFVPYLAWVSFATALNAAIWWLNR